MNIILVGPQGCGKGTQAELLADAYGYTHISTGDIIRSEIEKGDPTALKIKEGYDQGQLTPDDLVIELLKKNLSEKGNILDGFPRTLEQAHALDDIVEIDLVIELQLTDEVGIERLSTRRQCNNCRTIYGPAKPPKQEGICDKDGEKLYQRYDDKPEAIKKRLATYRKITEPLLEYYRPREIVHQIDASQKIHDIFKEICEIIEKTVEQTQ